MFITSHKVYSVSYYQSHYGLSLVRISTSPLAGARDSVVGQTPFPGGVWLNKAGPHLERSLDCETSYGRPPSAE